MRPEGAAPRGPLEPLPGALCGRTLGFPGKPGLVLRFQRLGKQTGDARCLFAVSVASGAVPTAPMVTVASVFVFVDEGQLVCGEGTWGRG